MFRVQKTFVVSNNLLPEQEGNPENESFSIYFMLFDLSGMKIANETFNAMLSECCRENKPFTSSIVFHCSATKFPFYYIDRHIVASYCVIKNIFFFFFFHIFHIFAICRQMCNTNRFQQSIQTIFSYAMKAKNMSRLS